MTTIRHIAEKAGVSIGTVDRVIHERGKVAPETAARVKRAIVELGYRPNVFARALKLGKIFRIAVIMPHPDQDGGYWRLPLAGIRRAETELASQHVAVSVFYFDKYRVHTSADLFQRILEASPDGLLMAPVGLFPFQELIEALPPLCPFVFFDSDLPGTMPLSVIYPDAYQSGRIAAELLHKVMISREEVLLLRVLPSDAHLEAREAGFWAYMREHDREVSILPVYSETDPQRFEVPLEARLLDRPVGGIFITNALAYRVAGVIDRLGLPFRPGLVGYDLIPANADWLKRGLIDFLIGQRPEAQGYQGVHLLFRHLLLKERVEKRVILPIDILTQENQSIPIAVY